MNPIYLFYLVFFISFLSCNNLAKKEDKAISSNKTVPLDTLVEKSQDTINSNSKDYLSEFIAEKPLDTDSFYIYFKHKPNNKRYIVWGNKKTKFEQASTDTIFNNCTTRWGQVFNIKTSNNYFYFTYSSGTGFSTATLLPILKDKKVRQFLCPIAYSAEQEYIAHYNFNWWTNNETLCVVTDLKTNKNKYLIGKNCDGFSPCACIEKAEFISNKLVIRWFNDHYPNGVKNHTQAFELDF